MSLGMSILLLMAIIIIVIACVKLNINPFDD